MILVKRQTAFACRIKRYLLLKSFEKISVHKCRAGGDNPYFRSYILTGKAHHTQIADFDLDTQNEIIEIIKSWVQE